MPLTLLSPVVTDFFRLLFTGLIGGIVGGWISFHFFIKQKRYETKHNDNVKRRDAIDDMLHEIHSIWLGIHKDWESFELKITELNKKIIDWRILFLDDPEMLSQIQKINNLIGVTKESFFGNNATIKEMPSEIIDTIEKDLFAHYKKIQNKIT